MNNSKLVEKFREAIESRQDVFTELWKREFLVRLGKISPSSDINDLMGRTFIDAEKRLADLRATLVNSIEENNQSQKRIIESITIVYIPQVSIVFSEIKKELRDCIGGSIALPNDFDNRFRGKLDKALLWAKGLIRQDAEKSMYERRLLKASTRTANWTCAMAIATFLAVCVTEWGVTHPNDPSVIKVISNHNTDHSSFTSGNK